MPEYHWLIIGGGPHGRFIAASILARAPGTSLAIVDPEPPMAAWQARAAACGMQYLRSSNAHHLGARADSLRRFAAAHGYDDVHALGYYRRPSLALFNAHAEAELGQPHQLHAGAVEIVANDAGHGWRVRLDDGRICDAARVVVATGPGQPFRPAGLTAAAHVFDADFELGAPGTATAIVGGGITGAQLALRAAHEGHRVYWVSRDQPRATDFDSDPCYAGPRCLAPFVREPLAERSRLLVEARQPGTLPPDIYSAITAALAGGELAWRRGDAVQRTDAGLRLADGRELAVDQVILATGFAHRPAADSLLGRVIAELGLATDGAGHIDVNDILEAAPGLHIAGRSASFQLGPMAGNIKGARLAGRCLAALAADERTAA
ncbi:FAD/NAD(P)-binding protein [Salinisphaera sp. SPP-AMP-43]|uniref:FAD/NAD(P)-binding protein n=1 Tax=Salinisphaera sp. SPP-AMP-43 TaxID=3121288 RepID=UPI003C6DED7A